MTGSGEQPKPAAERPYKFQHDVETIRAFLEQAWALAAWHRGRSQAFESKAATILGFSGGILTLLTLAAAPIATVDEDGWRRSLFGLMIATACAFLAAAVSSIWVLWPRKRSDASLDQLENEWKQYRDAPRLSTAQVLGMFADQLISGDGERSPIASHCEDAETRGRALLLGVASMVVGILLLMVMATILLLEVPRP